ncbi:MAG: S41 family peptidase [Gammaproteobacteria bacterium]
MKSPIAAIAAPLALLLSASAYAADPEPAPADAIATPAVAEPAAVPKPAEPLPLDDLRTFTEVFAKIKADYVEQVTDKQLLESAIRGMLAGLDPHSSYLDAEGFKDLQEGTTGEFGGLGIEVGMDAGFLKVIAPIDDTPAQRAGIKAGDIILKLDDTPVKGMGLNEAVKNMRGKPGTDISLSILREGEQKPMKFVLTRAIIRVQSVRESILEPGYGYLRVSQFQAHTGEDVVKALQKLRAENAAPLKGLVLDLRNNPGGVLGAAVAVSDAFLNEGLIVYTEGRVKDAALTFSAKPPDELGGAAMVVLVNAGSASASEIVAGALQDRKRAIVMGNRTFGKGSVQTIVPVNNETALKLTTARYFTPSGRSIQAEGIVPDIVLDKLRLAKADDNDDALIKEADLSRHLKNPEDEDDKAGDRSGAGKQPATKDKQNKPAAQAPRPRTPTARDDYEVHEALSLLKGMALLQARG